MAYPRGTGEQQQEGHLEEEGGAGRGGVRPIQSFPGEVQVEGDQKTSGGEGSRRAHAEGHVGRRVQITRESVRRRSRGQDVAATFRGNGGRPVGARSERLGCARGTEGEAERRAAQDVGSPQ